MLMLFAGVVRNGLVELMFTWVTPGVFRAPNVCEQIDRPVSSSPVAYKKITIRLRRNFELALASNCLCQTTRDWNSRCSPEREESLSRRRLTMAWLIGHIVSGNNCRR
jgi:hypothetical protein